MSLDTLVGKSLEIITPDVASISRLRAAAARSLGDAQLSNLSPEGRFDLAYKAIMQTANLALQANGYRTLTSRPGHHQTMIQSLPQTVGLDTSKMIVLDALRKQRNIIDYSGDLVSKSMAVDAVKYAVELIDHTHCWLKKYKPELL